MSSPRTLLRTGAIILMSAWLVSACATRVARAPLPPAQQQLALSRQQARETVLAAQPQWNLEGRVALSNGQRGGSGRIEWEQQGSTYQVGLSAPITRQSWRISGDAEAARLEGFDGGPRIGSDPQLLLREATGWDIPVANLVWWVRGVRAPLAAAGDAVAAPAAIAKMEFDGNGRLSRLQQDGWVLDYADWRQDSALGIEMPHRINAAREPARVRLVVDVWGSDIARGVERGTAATAGTGRAAAES